MPFRIIELSPSRYGKNPYLNRILAKKGKTRLLKTDRKLRLYDILPNF